MLAVLAVLAVGAAAVAFVAGTGTYLYIRFTQNRRKPSKDDRARTALTSSPDRASILPRQGPAGQREDVRR